MLVDILLFLNWAILLYLIIFSLGYTILLTASVHDLILRFQEVTVGDVLPFMKSHALQPVTALVPMYNEEEGIIDSINSILNSEYPNLHILMINDGSTDKTLEKLITTYQLTQVPPVIPEHLPMIGKVIAYYVSSTHKNITLIDKEHTDKSDSLNIGLNACRTPLCMTIDADTLVEPDAISEIIYYMLTKPHMVAVGGAVYILNGCKIKDGKIVEANMPYQFLPAIQATEYLRSFLFSRTGWNTFGGALCYSGAFTLFEHQLLINIGGFDIGNPANDFEIITHLQAQRSATDTPYQLGFTPAATAWTDVPRKFKEYWHQRTLWQIGTLRSLAVHKSMLFNPKHGIMGLCNYPFYLFGEALGPLVELTAYLTVGLAWYLDLFNAYSVFLFMVICWGIAAFLTMATVLMSLVTYNRYRRKRDIMWIFFLVIAESFGFRQYQVICRTIATIKYFFVDFDQLKKNERTKK